MSRGLEANESAIEPSLSTDGASELAGPDAPGSTRSSTLGNAFADARPVDPAGLQIARARVAAGLFGSSESSEVGRFQLLDRVGAGGMGVIYAAFDPELERAVAVKLVHIAGADRAPALAEAKALARLAHPNVVAIFDFGFLDDHLFIVMELVIGQTLERWARGKTQPEILKAYRQAGEALAAAHAAGLIHRDFKPDNAIMGADGRVRVVDFGLACAVAGADKERSMVAGTPGFMAPEQLRGESLSPATDQFGFCVALQRSLQSGKSAIVPRWLQLVLERGRAASARDRYSSMSELLLALARDPALIRRRWLAAGALLGACALAAAAGRVSSNLPEESCGSGAAELSSVWGIQGARPALDRITALGPYAATLRPLLERTLSDHSERYATGYRAACLARARGVESPALLDRRMACLERSRAALKSVVEIFDGVPADKVSDLILAARALPDPSACSDLTALLAEGEPPPNAIAPSVALLRAKNEQTRIQIAAGRSREVTASIEQTVGAARTLSYKPLLAESLELLGHALINAENPSRGEPPLTEAFSLAFESGLFSLGVEAWARRAFLRATSLGQKDSLSGLDIVEAIAVSHSASRFSRALLHNNVGCAELALERRDRARPAFELAAREAIGLGGASAAELLGIRANLALATDDRGLRAQLFAQAEAEYAQVLGTDHPQTLWARWKRGSAASNLEQARELLTPTCRAMEEQRAPAAQRCWVDEGLVRAELDDAPGALATLERAASLKVGAESSWPALPGYIQFWRGNLKAAEQQLTSQLLSLPPAMEQPWWERQDRAELELALGRVLRARGDLPAAQRMLTASLRDFRSIVKSALPVAIDRRMGRARAELAHVLLSRHQSLPVACSLAASASEWLRQARGSAPEVAEFERSCAL